MISNVFYYRGLVQYKKAYLFRRPSPMFEIGIKAGLPSLGTFCVVKESGLFCNPFLLRYLPTPLGDGERTIGTAKANVVCY